LQLKFAVFNFTLQQFAGRIFGLLVNNDKRLWHFESCQMLLQIGFGIFIPLLPQPQDPKMKYLRIH
jgi:hypothetical protein